MIKVGVVGCEGRLAKEIINLIEAEESLMLLNAIARPTSKNINTDIGEHTKYEKNSVLISGDLMACTECDVIIDATKRDVFMELNIDKYMALKKPLIIATTGFSEEDMQRIHELSRETQIVQSANFSFELHYFIKALKSYIQSDRELDVTIIEKHHKKKIDAPSGTALMIKNALIEANPKVNAEVLSIRSGIVTGEHTVFISNQDGEEIEFTHRATNRKMFASGIIKVIPLLLQKDYGMYDMQSFC